MPSIKPLELLECMIKFYVAFEDEIASTETIVFDELFSFNHL